MTVTAIRDCEAPRLQAIEEMGKDVDLEAILTREFEEQELASNKEMWDIVGQAIFDKFITNCVPNMQEKLADTARWDAVKTRREDIGLQSLMDQAMKL